MRDCTRDTRVCDSHGCTCQCSYSLSIELCVYCEDRMKSLHNPCIGCVVENACKCVCRRILYTRFCGDHGCTCQCLCNPCIGLCVFCAHKTKSRRNPCIGCVADHAHKIDGGNNAGSNSCAGCDHNGGALVFVAPSRLHVSQQGNSQVSASRHFPAAIANKSQSAYPLQFCDILRIPH